MILPHELGGRDFGLLRPAAFDVYPERDVGDVRLDEHASGARDTDGVLRRVGVRGRAAHPTTEARRENDGRHHTDGCSTEEPAHPVAPGRNE